MKNFKESVQLAIENGFKKELAKEFEVAESTVDRWANGVASPLPKLQTIIVYFIGHLMTDDQKF